MMKSLPLFLMLATVGPAPALAMQWPEPGGPFGTRTARDVDGPRIAPAELWRFEADGVLSEPVVSEGVVYAVVRQGRKPRLVGLDVTTGEEVVGASVTAEDFAAVSVSGTRIVVTSGDGLRSFERKDGRLKKGKVVRGEFRSAASLFGGLAAATTSEGVRVFHLKTGKALVESEGDVGKPLVLPSGKDDGFVVLASAHREVTMAEPFGKSSTTTRRYLDSWAIEAASTRKPSAQRLLERVLATVRPSDGLITELAPVRGARKGQLYFLVADRAAPGAEIPNLPRLHFCESRFIKDESKSRHDACVVGRSVFGRDAGGRLYTQRVYEDAKQLMAPAREPEGARNGPISSADGVLLLGNWALDLRTTKILWVAPDLDADGVLIPAADGVVVYVSTSGDLVAAGDRRGQGASSEAPAVAGVVDAAEPVGPVGAAHAQLDAAFAEDLAKVFGTYADRDLLAEARRVLTELRARGMAADALRSLDAKLVGRTESIKGNREQQLEAVHRGEEEARTAAVNRAIESTSSWLAGRTDEPSLLVAGARLHWALGVWPDGALPADIRTTIREAAQPWVPSSFTLSAGKRRGQVWLEWAHELAPAGASFFDPSEVEDLGAPWTKRTVGVRSRNIELLSRSLDPVIVGACLRHAEGAVQTLHRILDQPEDESAERMEVRIHANREDYLTEDLGGFKANEWSVGFYSPMHRASRFYVATEETPFHQGRDLHEVVAHEVTHQFIQERWEKALEGRRRTPKVPSYWLVEGFARFIEDQSLEVGRRGLGFDDPTVQSVDSAAALAGIEKLLPMDKFLLAPQLSFAKLPTKAAGRVRLSSSLMTLTHSAKTIFYDQGGALVFFLMNRCGDDGRARLIETLGAHYRGETTREIWTSLGFESLDALEAAFLAFLAKPQ